jgi:chemotaxis protein MotB
MRLLTALLLVTACGVPKEKHAETLKQLDACRAELGTCQKDKGAATAKVAELEGQLKTANEERDKANATVAETAKNLKSTKEELEDLRKQRAEVEKRLAAFRALTAKFQKMIDAGKLKVAIRGGRMILQLPAGILFASGKADVSKEGQTVLAEVTATLKEFTDRKFLIAGHTDNVPLKASKYKDNWELATARALTVTKFLIGAGMNPVNVAAAGYAEFDPVADNKSEPGKQQNRRIEIILVPNIEELPGMPEDKS